jgi:hypothetical protein
MERVDFEAAGLALVLLAQVFVVVHWLGLWWV